MQSQVTSLTVITAEKQQCFEALEMAYIQRVGLEKRVQGP